MLLTKNQSLRRQNCRLCGGIDLDLVLPLTPTPVGDAYVPLKHTSQVQPVFPLDLYLCRSCGHLQLLEVVDPEVLYGEFTYTTSISLGLVEHFQSYATDILRKARPPQGALVVDIGSNDGTLLRCFQERGMRVLGIDPAREIAHKATESGIETLPTCFTAELGSIIKDERGAAAVVTANNAFANVDDLVDLTEGIKNLLAPDGVFVMETGYAVDLVQQRLFDNVYHEHLSYFSVKPLDAFLRRCGLELIDVERVSTKGGSLRAVARTAGYDQTASASVGRLIGLEESLGIHDPRVYHSFAGEISATRERLAELLGEIKSQGKTVAGYGASVGVTTLIYQLDLGGALSFIVDDNPVKFNRYSPGHHIRVVAPQAIYDRKPDYVLVLAWRYAKTIMEKHQAYLAQGGHFIVPLPEVEVR